MDNKKIIFASYIASLVNAAFSIISTITAVGFAVMAAAFAEMAYTNLEQVESMSIVLATISKVVVVLFWIMLVLAIVSLATYGYTNFKIKDITEKEKKYSLYSCIGSGIAVLMGLLSIRGMQAFNAFGQIMTLFAQDPEYFDFEFFDFDLLVDSIQSLEVPYLLMRISIFVVGVLTLLLIVQNSKDKKEGTIQQKPTTLPTQEKTSTPEEEKPALPVEEKEQEAQEKEELPQLPKIPETPDNEA